MAAKLSGPRGGGKTIVQNADINVTPFVDVMLVLLIIFMVAAPLATVSLRLDLPPPVPTPGPPEEPIFVSLQQSGALYIGVQETGLSTLAADLSAFVGGAEPTQERIFVRADGDVRYLDFMSVMNALQDGGFYKVALIGEDMATTL